MNQTPVYIKQLPEETLEQIDCLYNVKASLLAALKQKTLPFPSPFAASQNPDLGTLISIVATRFAA